MNRMYMYTLRQEVLNEQAANIIADLGRYCKNEGIDCSDDGEPLAELMDYLHQTKLFIVSFESQNHLVLDEIQRELLSIQEFVRRLECSREVA